MVLAVALLFLQFAPAAHALPDVDLASVPAVKAAAEDTKSGQPKPAPSTTARTSTSSSTDSVTGNAAPVAFTLASLTSDSQNGQALDTIRVPEGASPKPVRVILAEAHPRRAWLLLSIAEHSAATFDAYSTREAVSKGAAETDPFMQPFAHSPAMYGAIQVCPLVLDYAARRMERSEHGLLRRTWWVPQTAATGLFLFSGAHNLNVANSMR
jgi:hypothetical protein